MTHRRDGIGIGRCVETHPTRLAELVTGQSIHVDFYAEGVALEAAPEPEAELEKDTSGRQQTLF